jgi:hypothetical protein
MFLAYMDLLFWLLDVSVCIVLGVSYRSLLYCPWRNLAGTVYIAVLATRALQSGSRCYLECTRDPLGSVSYFYL